MTTTDTTPTDGDPSTPTPPENWLDHLRREAPEGLAIDDADFDLPPRGLQAFDAAVGPDIVELLAEYEARLADPRGEHPRSWDDIIALLAGYLSIRRNQLAEAPTDS